MHPSSSAQALSSVIARALSGLSLVALVACGGEAGSSTSGSGGGSSSSTTSGSGGAAAGKMTISGHVVSHSLNKLATQKTGVTPDYSALTMSLYGHDALLADPAAAPLATTPLVTTGCSMNPGCAYTFSAVDLSGASGGIAIGVSDTRATPIWVTTETNTFNAAELASYQASGGAYDLGVGFALSRDAVDTVLAGLVGLTGDELLARGLVFGLVYSTAPTATSSGEALAGATVEPSTSGYTVVYPTANFSATQATTGGQGAFLLVPSAAAAPASVTVTVTPPAGSTLTWDATQTAVVRKGSIYFMRLSPK